MYLYKRLVILAVCLLSITVLISACRGRTEAPRATPPTTPAITQPPSEKVSPANTSTATDEEKLGLHSTKPTGNQKYIVIWADFPDVKRIYPVDTTSNRMGN